MTELDLYWILMLDNVSTTLTWVFGILSILVVGTLIPLLFVLSDCYSEKRPLVILFSLEVLAFLLVAVVGTFLPDTKQMLTILVAPKVLNSQQEAIGKLQETPEKVIDLINQKLDEELKKHD